MADVLVLRCASCALAARFNAAAFTGPALPNAMRAAHRRVTRGECAGAELSLDLGHEPMPEGDGAMLRTPWISAPKMALILDAARSAGIEISELSKVHQVARRAANAAVVEG